MSRLLGKSSELDCVTIDSEQVPHAVEGTSPVLGEPNESKQRVPASCEPVCMQGIVRYFCDC